MTPSFSDVSKSYEDRLRTDSLGTFAECGNELSGHIDIQFEDNVVTSIRNLNKCSNAVGHDSGVVIGKQVSAFKVNPPSLKSLI